MIDVLIIIAYLLVVLKLLLNVFNWFQDYFNINGKIIRVTKQSPQLKTSPKGIKQSQLEFTSNKSLKKISSTLTQSFQNGFVRNLPQEKNNIRQDQPQSQDEKKETEQSLVEPQKSEVFQEQKPATEASQQIAEGSKQPQVKQNTTVNIQIKRNQLFENNLLDQLSEANQRNRALNDLITCLKVEINNLTHKVSEATQTSCSQNKVISQLRVQKSNLALKFQEKLEQTQSLQQGNWKLSQQLIEQKKQYDNLILQMRTEFVNQLQQTKRFSQTRDQLQEISNQTTEKAQHRIEETVNETISINDSKGNTDKQIRSLRTRVEQLKHELQFCQSQLQNASQTQKKLKEENCRLVSNTSSRLKPRGQISISDVVSHSQYLRIKEKLQKYQSGISSSRPKSIIRSQLTPQGQRLGKATDSRISQRRSFVSSRLSQPAGNKSQHSETVFGECNFLNGESKQFLLSQLKKIKKLAIKNTKLIFRLDKLYPINPHEFIDNIPNILILIELTNKKVLAAFTQMAFSKQEVSHTQKSSAIKYRVGQNKALMLDLTNKVALHNNSPHETIVYDQNAIVWGKDELVIKNDQPTLLYSSFGSGQGIYSDGKYTLEELLGGTQGFERINQYEFHKIYIS